jgi:uncharacterized protein YcbX
MDPARGTVAAMWRWPVESMAGERVDGLRVDGRGAGGDRTHTVTSGGEPLTAREAPRLLAWSAAYPFNLGAGLDPAHPPFAVVTAPDGHSYRWGDPRLRSALAADLDRPVELLRDVERIRSLQLTTEASLMALAREVDGPVDLRRFRGNVHLDLDGPAWADEGWHGAELAFAGGVRLRVLEPCERSSVVTLHPDTQAEWPGLLDRLTSAHGGRFGFNARVLAGGRIGVGEAVEVMPF